MILFKNISGLYGAYRENPSRICGAEMARWPVIHDAFLYVRDGKIMDFGPMSALPESSVPLQHPDLIQTDCMGRILLPGFCDSHTHLVFAGSRENEFIDKINGLSYEEIARRGGGILNSAKRLAAASENELYASASARLEEVIRKGTTAIEIKSGYGLDLENELKMLRVIRRLKETYPIHIKATLLAAHALPAEYKNNREGFVEKAVREFIPAAAQEGLADFVDVFCENGFFSVEDTLRILEAGAKFGIPGKIHGNQLGHSGGVQAAVKAGALSVDHLEHLNEEEMKLLRESRVIPTVLPNCSFYLRMIYSPARKMIEAGLPVCIATDFNPGSAPSGDMLFAVSLACIQMRLLTEEAFCAATINGAAAMSLESVTGSITPGKSADFILTKPVPSLAYLPYRFTGMHIEQVYAHGNPVVLL
jgi:imidazolonepropionase